MSIESRSYDCFGRELETHQCEYCGKKDTLEGSAVSELYNNDRIPSFMRYLPKEGEQLIYEDIYIPDVD